MGFVRESRLGRSRQGHLTEHFVAGTTARTAAVPCGVNRTTAACFHHRLREVIAYGMEAEADAIFDGEIEVDERCSGGRRKGKRGRATLGPPDDAFPLVWSENRVSLSIAVHWTSDDVLGRRVRTLPDLRRAASRDAKRVDFLGRPI